MNNAGNDSTSVIEDERQGVLDASTPDKINKPFKVSRACSAGQIDETGIRTVFSS